MRCVALAFVVFCCNPLVAVAQETAKLPATLKVSGVAKDKGELSMTLTVEWAGGQPQPKADEVTVVLLLQDKKGPATKLDAALLSTLREDNLLGILGNGCAWILRTAEDAPNKRFVDVFQVIGSGDKKATDFRKNGDAKLAIQLSYPGGRGLTTDSVQVGLFEEMDPKKWQQSSTSYKQLSNIVDVSKK